MSINIKKGMLFLLVFALIFSIEEIQAQNSKNDTIKTYDISFYKNIKAEIDSLFKIGRRYKHTFENSVYHLYFWHSQLYLHCEYSIKYHHMVKSIIIDSRVVHVVDKKDLKRINEILLLTTKLKKTYSGKFRVDPDNKVKGWYVPLRWTIDIDLGEKKYSLKNRHPLFPIKPKVGREKYTSEDLRRDRKICRKLMRIIKHQKKLHKKNLKVPSGARLSK